MFDKILVFPAADQGDEPYIRSIPMIGGGENRDFIKHVRFPLVRVRFWKLRRRNKKHKIDEFPDDEKNHV